MKTLKFSVVAMVVFTLISGIQASEPNKNPVMISTENLNITSNVKSPVPVDGYGKLQDKIEYPESARTAGLEPRILVQAYVDAEGCVHECKMLEGPEKIGFEEAIFNAIRKTEWTPAYYDGQATSANVQITFQFKLYE